MKDTTRLVGTDRNGTQVFHDFTCTRCGGKGGADQWVYTGYTCYKCGGSGRQDKPTVTKIYTPEYKAKLDAKRIKKHLAEIAEQNAKYFDYIGVDSNGNGFVYVNSYEIKDILKENGARFNSLLGWVSPERIAEYSCYEINVMDVTITECLYRLDDEKCDTFVKEIKAIEKAKSEVGVKKSEFVGAIGDKIEFNLKFARFVTEFQSQFGITYLYEFKDENENVYTWFTGKTFRETEVTSIKGTIKDHKDYNGTKQTVLTRCKVI